MQTGKVSVPDDALFDTHCHLNLEQFEQDRAAVVKRAQESGVHFVVIPGIDLETSRSAIELAEQLPHVYAAVGIHPNSSDGLDNAGLDALRAMAAHPKVVAIGEIGLDYYWDKVSASVQADGFRAQLGLAADVGLPVIIHNREASEDVASILGAWVKSDAFQQSPLAKRAYPGVLHAFGGPMDLATQAIDWNFVFGLGGPITFTNARELHALVPQLPLDRLMIETDAPYLSPHPYRGKRNEPARVALVAQRLAELFDQPLSQIASSTTSLALAFFGLDAADGDVASTGSNTKIASSKYGNG